MKITDYVVVGESSPFGLQTKINSWIKSGYQPYGEMTVDLNSNVNRYIQVVVKYKD